MGFQTTKALEMYIFSSSEPVPAESLEQELELDEASTALIYLCDLVGSRASSVPFTQQTFIKRLLAVVGALRIKNEYTLTLSIPTESW